LKNLFLIGLPGSGKTTLGRQLAAHYGWPFLDLDVEIEKQAGRSIAALFAAKGEAGFRAVEAAVLRAALEQQPAPFVLATGGGTPCFHDNMALLKQHGFTLWLDVPVDVIVARLPATESAKRPLLATTDGDIARRLRETLAARIRFYEHAALRCPAATAPIPEVVRQLAAAGFPG
jgi:shikimate kinase